MADAKEDKKDAPKKAETLRVTLHCPAKNGKVFTSMGTLGNGACVVLPAAQGGSSKDKTAAVDAILRNQP